MELLFLIFQLISIFAGIFLGVKVIITIAFTIPEQQNREIELLEKILEEIEKLGKLEK